MRRRVRICWRACQVKQRQLPPSRENQSARSSHTFTPLTHASSHTHTQADTKPKLDKDRKGKRLHVSLCFLIFFSSLSSTTMDNNASMIRRVENRLTETQHALIFFTLIMLLSRVDSVLTCLIGTFSFRSINSTQCILYVPHVLSLQKVMTIIKMSAWGGFLLLPCTSCESFSVTLSLD